MKLKSKMLLIITSKAKIWVRNLRKILGLLIDQFTCLDPETKDKFAEALKAYEKADSLQPDNPLIQFGLGSTLLHMDQLDKAVEKLKLTIRLAEMVKKPDTVLLQAVARSYNNLAIIRFEQGKLDLAKKNFKKVSVHEALAQLLLTYSRPLWLTTHCPIYTSIWV